MQEHNNYEQKESIWVSTREISEACDISIYRARYLLLKMKSNGGIIQEPVRQKTHRWRPSGILQR
ncbi:FaeA/PapI family transcriptional regulator [Serratia ureilytica]|uniref:FaeA/PapI family transcriptional regulator n=1 Tax=Serratia ureilytica TaxID=300181 RepID=UPI0034C5F7B6